MTFRFFRRIRIAPGLSLNLSKSGPSLSFGPRGTKLTVGRHGVHRSVGLPGTGMYYTTRRSWSGKSRKGVGNDGQENDPDRPPQVEDALTLGFFKRLVTPKGEEALVDGMKEVVRENPRRALGHLKNSAHLADGAFLAGMMALKLEEFENARRYLNYALTNQRRLGKQLGKFGINAAVSLPITSEIAAVVGPDRRGVLLAQVEACQHQGDWTEAIGYLKRLYSTDKDDLVVKVSVSEILVNELGDRRSLKDALKFSEGAENDSSIHGALLLYRAKAPRLLGVCEGARDLLTALLRRRKGRGDDLLNAIRFERVLVYEVIGRHKQARSDFERVYAADPEFEGVAAQLGI